MSPRSRMVRKPPAQTGSDGLIQRLGSAFVRGPIAERLTRRKTSRVLARDTTKG